AGQGGDFDELIEGIRDLKPVAPVTRLGTGVEGVLKDLRGNVPAAIILLSDGINTEGPSLSDAAAAARRRGVPLFVVGTGDQRPIRDIKLTDLLVDEVVFVDDIVSFEIKLAATGFKDREVEVLLKQEGKSKVLARKKVKIEGQGKSLQVRLRYRPKEEGEFRFRVEVLPLEGELQTDNNAQDRKVRVRKEKIRVLLVAGYPNYEFRYMRNMLARDNTIELNSVLQDADVKSAEQDATSLRVFPVRREEIFSYDVIIMGDVDPRRLGGSAMKNLAEFVGQPAKGGALVLIAGPRHMPAGFRDTPLAALLPIKLGGVRAPLAGQTITDGFVARPTDLGLACPAMQLGDTPNESMEIWEKLPELYWMLETPEVKMGTRVLAVNPRRAGADGRALPLICLQYVGAGKVLFHATDETWRWRWRAGDTFFARYWVQMIRYLSRSKLFGGEGSVVLSTDRREYREGRPVRFRLRYSDPRRAPAKDDGVTVVVEQQGRQTRTLKLRRGDMQGIFEGVLPGAGAGRYHAWLSRPAIEDRTPSVDFEVAAAVGEFENVRMDETAMRQAAEETKGRYYSVAEADRLLKDLPPGRQVHVATLPPLTLWNRWPVLVLLLSLLVAEWVGRKVKGMA
ncbi:MAG: VWA domain-containing protein, partial [Planctomycetota bacterium]|nr:VWA domain-containing protein [Planctomycetota bacterium]